MRCTRFRGRVMLHVCPVPPTLAPAPWSTWSSSPPTLNVSQHPWWLVSSGSFTDLELVQRAKGRQVVQSPAKWRMANQVRSNALGGAWPDLVKNAFLFLISVVCAKSHPSRTATDRDRGRLGCSPNSFPPACDLVWSWVGHFSTLELHSKLW